MSRNKQRGTSWESAIVKFLHAAGFPYAERRALAGAKDRGDLTGIPGLVVEAKNVSRLDLSGWLDEAELERDNDGARYGVVWLKRRGYTDPGRSYVLMSGYDFAKLLRDATGVEEKAS